MTEQGPAAVLVEVDVAAAARIVQAVAAGPYYLRQRTRAFPISSGLSPLLRLLHALSYTVL
jgi:hypothetical protein